MMNNDRLFATAPLEDPSGDLGEFLDTAMHWDCYARWEHRMWYARMYFKAHRPVNGIDAFSGPVAYSDENLVVIATSRNLGEVRVLLAATGSLLVIDYAEWEDWLKGTWIESCNHEIEREAVANVLPLLRSRLPTAGSVVAAAGMKMEVKTAPPSGMVERISYEIACEKLAGRAARKGIACPGCAAVSKDYDYVRIEMVSETGPLSHLVCRACGKEFGPLDV